MTFLLDLINGVHKFLGYLDISPKYLNRGYTILSVIPTLYLLRIFYGLWQNQNYLQFFFIWTCISSACLFYCFKMYFITFSSIKTRKPMSRSFL